MGCFLVCWFIQKLRRDVPFLCVCVCVRDIHCQFFQMACMAHEIFTQMQQDVNFGHLFAVTMPLTSSVAYLKGVNTVKAKIFHLFWVQLVESLNIFSRNVGWMAMKFCPLMVHSPERMKPTLLWWSLDLSSRATIAVSEMSQQHLDGLWWNLVVQAPIQWNVSMYLPDGLEEKKCVQTFKCPL